jgi:hypothetical protein
MSAAVKWGSFEDINCVWKERDKEQFFERESQVVSTFSCASNELSLWRYMSMALHNRGVLNAISRKFRQIWPRNAGERGPASGRVIREEMDKNFRGDFHREGQDGRALVIWNL